MSAVLDRILTHLPHCGPAHRKLLEEAAEEMRRVELALDSERTIARIQLQVMPSDCAAAVAARRVVELVDAILLDPPEASNRP